MGLKSLYEDGPSENPIRLVGAEEPAPERPDFDDEQPTRNLDLVPVESQSTPLMPDMDTAGSESENVSLINNHVPPAPTPLSDSVKQALREAEGNEVVCIIRSRKDPSAPSRVIIIHEASEQFVSELTGELHNQIRPASVEVRNKPTEPVISVPTPSVEAFFGRPDTSDSTQTSSVTPRPYRRSNRWPPR